MASIDQAVIETSELSKRYRHVTALSQATITVPPGRISALVGPNSAGKTTLLRLLAGLARPTAGEIAVLGAVPRQNPAFLAGVGFLAQEIPLYRRFTATDHIRFGAHLNSPCGRNVGATAAGEPGHPARPGGGHAVRGPAGPAGAGADAGQRSRLLLLDEPVAALDPLARRQFLAHLAEAVADTGLTVVLSSHLVADLERTCDHLILLAAARVQLCGDIDTLLAEHQVLIGPRKDTTAIERDHTLVHAVRTARQATLLIRRNGPVVDPAYEAADVGLEELVLGSIGLHGDPAPAGLSANRRRSMTSGCLAPAPQSGVRRRRRLRGAGGGVAHHRPADGVAISSPHACRLLGQPFLANLANTLTIGSPRMTLLITLTVVVPCLLGVFFGGPLVARELEIGTNQFGLDAGRLPPTLSLGTQVGWSCSPRPPAGGAVRPWSPRGPAR